MKTLRIALAATVALTMAAPAFAQPQPNEQYRRDQDTYQSQQDSYQAQQDNYRSDRADYDARRAGYERARAEYQARRDRYDTDRARYDERYGEGAYARVYGPAPAWDNDRWQAQGYGPAPSVEGYGRNAGYIDPCARTRNNDKVAGGLIGALAGAALGSNIAANGRGTEGTVLGAVVGGVVGANVGAAAAKARCDEAGYYYNYADTVPYREGRYARSADYDSYYHRGCRLAAAPVDQTGDVRYVRVCPDDHGHYRITG